MKLLYGTSTAITITLTSLASAAARSSAVIDNSTTDYLDALVGGSFKTASGTLGTNPVVSVYVYALTDGTHYTDGVTGTDAAFTMLTTPAMILAAQVPINASATVAYMSPFSVASLFGGTLPQKFGVVIVNSTGLALDSTAPGGLAYTGITTQ